MEIARDKVFKVEVVSIKEFVEKYGGGVTPQAIDYAMDNDKIDYTVVGQYRFVVMTEKTRQYVPNAHPSRDKTVKKKRSVMTT